MQDLKYTKTGIILKHSMSDSQGMGSAETLYILVSYTRQKLLPLPQCKTWMKDTKGPDWSTLLRSSSQICRRDELVTLWALAQSIACLSERFSPLLIPWFAVIKIKKNSSVKKIESLYPCSQLRSRPLQVDSLGCSSEALEVVSQAYFLGIWAIWAQVFFLTFICLYRALFSHSDY